MVVPPAEVPVVPDDPARGPEEVVVVGGAARRRALRWGLRLVELGPVLILAVRPTPSLASYQQPTKSAPSGSSW